MLTLLTGALAGSFHVLAGPDHLAAVAPLALDRKEKGWVAGWTWGFGHATGVVAVAALAVLLRDALPPIEAISAWGERVVGVALIALGFWALRHSMRIRLSEHVHGVMHHDHLHLHAGPAWLRRLGHVHASFCLGVLHGIAGSSHFFGVLPALALPTRAAAFTYIGAFGVGTVIAMTCFAAILGGAAARSDNHQRLQQRLMATAAVLAIVVGGVWLM
jgi:hypothetical protein